MPRVDTVSAGAEGERLTAGGDTGGGCVLQSQSGGVDTRNWIALSGKYS